MTRVWKFVLEHYLVLPIGGAIALVWANTYAVSYFQVAQVLAFLVNDVGMAFVLAYVAQEVIEGIMPGGSLHPWRHTILPVAGAIGGIAGAGVVYSLYVGSGDEDVLLRGWPIACAVDVLACVAIARNIFERSVATTFLLLLAIACDVVGLTFISHQRFASVVHPAAAALIVA